MSCQHTFTPLTPRRDCHLASVGRLSTVVTVNDILLDIRKWGINNRYGESLAGESLKIQNPTVVKKQETEDSQTYSICSNTPLAVLILLLHGLCPICSLAHYH